MKRQQYGGSPCKKLDEACYKWLVNARRQSISISATMLKKNSSSLQRSLVAMIFVHQVVGWTDVRREKSFLLR